MSFFTGFGVSASIYYLLNLAFPVPGFTKHFQEIDLSEMTHEVDAPSLDEPESNPSPEEDKIAVGHIVAPIREV